MKILLLILPLIVLNSFMVVLKDFPSFENIGNMDHIEKGRYIFQLLQNSAKIQRKYLKNFKNYRQFWISNSILVEEFDKSILNSPDILEIYEYPKYKVIQPIPSSNLATTTWNLNKINVKSLWDRNFSGNGVTVANIDTGVSFTHPGLLNSYRGYKNSSLIQHDYNWFDGVKSGTNSLCGIDTNYPCDDNNHGSFTMGVQVGNLPSQTYGPAYNSKWIACRGFNEGSIVDGAVESCLQFMLAPSMVNGSNPNVDLRPDILSNSYGLYDSTTLKRSFDALNAAGVMIIASLGNFGTCGVQIIPASYPYAISVSSTDINNAISTFSSRGPVLGNNLFKPEVTAPGTDITSFNKEGGTTIMSGTSHSGPLIGGFIAVLWSSVEGLKNNLNATRTILLNSTLILKNTECSIKENYPNYAFGYGLPQLDLAYQNAISSPKCFNYFYFDSKACSSKGICTVQNGSLGVCNCNNMYYGNECQIAISCNGIPFNLPNVCSGRGSCYSINQCSCINSTYYGNNCQFVNISATPNFPRNNTNTTINISQGIYLNLYIIFFYIILNI